MKINTKYFGEHEVKNEEIVQFPKGLFGFEDNQNYTLIPFDDSDESSFLCLQSIDDEDLAFILFNPFYLDSNYKPELAKEDMRDLEIGEMTPVSFLVITVVHDDFHDSTVNMKCPIVINNSTKRAKQVILEADYQMRQRITPQEKKGA